VLSDLGDTAGALREAELAAPHLHGVEFAILLIQRAWVFQRAGRLEEALADYRGARLILRREPSALHEARLFSNRSLLFIQQGPPRPRRPRPGARPPPVRGPRPGRGGRKPHPNPGVRGRPPRRRSAGAEPVRPRGGALRGAGDAARARDARLPSRRGPAVGP